MAMLLRALIVLGLLGSAWVHLDLWLLGYQDIEVIGPLFLVNVIAGVVLAIAVLAWWHWVPMLLAAGFGAATLGAYVLSVTVGLFGMRNDVYWEPNVLLAAAAEIVCIVAGLLAVRQARRT